MNELVLQGDNAKGLPNPGGRVTMRVTGIVIAYEIDPVDVTALGNKPHSDVLPGEHVVTVLVQETEVLEKVEYDH